MAEDFYIDEVQDYLEHKSELNKLVGHKKISDEYPTGRRAFSRFASDEHINEIKNSGANNIVVVANYNGKRVGEIDEKKLRITIEVLFAVRKEAGTGDETDAINEALKTAEKILFQYWNQLEKDFQEGCNALEFLEPQNINWHPLDDMPWLNDFYGYILNIPFGSYVPAHNDDDWEEEDES